MTGPTDVGLPDGFQVQIDPRCVRRGDLSSLVGGSPTRVLKLSDAALGMTSADGRVAVFDDATRSLARTLLDSGIGLPRPMGGPGLETVTVVIPVRDNQSGIDALLRELSGTTVIVVDDGSAEPIRATGTDVTLIRFDDNRGPAAARNAGLAAAETEFIAFLDSDTLPTADWLTMLLAHFSDPKVAIVAPRIVGDRTAHGGSLVARYANAHSSLDMGPSESPVAPGTALAYVPSAAMVLRRSAFLGFDEDLRVAEDVDLCWRTHEAGWRVYYDPVARVRHNHRTTLREMLGRRRFYGTGAAVLADRHGPTAAPVMTTLSMGAVAVALLTRTRIGLLIAMVLSLRAVLRTRSLLVGVPDRDLLAVRFIGQGVGFSVLQVAQALLRHYWPASLVLALVSARFRNLLLQLAVGEAVVMWVRGQILQSRSPAIGPLGFALMHRLDDLAYGTGLWQGALTQCSPEALRPSLVNQRG